MWLRVPDGGGRGVYRHHGQTVDLRPGDEVLLQVGLPSGNRGPRDPEGVLRGVGPLAQVSRTVAPS